MSSAGSGGASVPPYPFTHSGPVLVCGSAQCFADDLDRARSIFPDAPAIAVNGAAGHVKALILFSQHARKLPRWIEQQRSRFWDGFTVHSAGRAHAATRLGKTPPMPWVQYRWADVATGGTSAWGARRLARFIGFGPVILVGCPLVAGGYHGGGMASKSNMSEDTMRHYREQVAADKDFHDGVLSMSGWTAEFFGTP